MDIFHAAHRHQIAAALAYHTAITVDAPLAWWRMDTVEGTQDYNNVRNSSAGAPLYVSTFTLVQTPVISRGKSILLTSTGYLTRGGVLWNGASHTHELWVKFNTAVTNMAVIGYHATIASANGWAVTAIASGSAIGLNLWAKDSGGNIVFNQTTGYDFAIGQDLHIVIYQTKASGGTYALYVNGVQKISGTSTGIADPSGSEFRIGKSNDGFWANPNFYVDEYALYSGLLSSERITAHYNAGIAASTITPYATRILQQNTLFYLRCKETDWTGDPTGTVSSEIAVSGSSDLFGQTTAGNRPTQNIAGLINNDTGSKTFQYDGVDDYISSQFGALSNLGTQISLTGWTILAWVKPTAVTAVNRCVISSHDTGISSGEEIFSLRITNTTAGASGPQIKVKMSNGQFATVRGNANQPLPEASVRYFLAATFDKANGFLKLYVNGGLLEQRTDDDLGAPLTGLSMASGMDHILIGCGKFDASLTDFVTGTISEISVHNTVLSANDILALAVSAVD